MKYIARFIFWIIGWKIDPNPPENIKKCVIAVGPHTSNWDFILGRLAFFQYGVQGKFLIKKTAFSGKAFATVELMSSIKVITLNPNSYQLKEIGSAAKVEDFTPEFKESDFSTMITDIVRASDKIALPDAELVVSAGRGMKGPENWAMIEELASLLGAATACSKPVSDSGWRPHEEHVGQTGIAVSPNLYIAIGISGAIQHLAGVSSSKTIVVINKDPEAPFFKVADYGIVGDAFDVVPKLIESVKAYKSIS